MVLGLVPPVKNGLGTTIRRARGLFSQIGSSSLSMVTNISRAVAIDVDPDNAKNP